MSDNMNVRNTDLMKIDEVAQMLGYTIGFVYRLVYKRQIPFIKLSRKALRFKRESIERWIESRSKECQPESLAVQEAENGK